MSVSVKPGRKIDPRNRAVLEQRKLEHRTGRTRASAISTVRSSTRRGRKAVTFHRARVGAAPARAATKGNARFIPPALITNSLTAPFGLNSKQRSRTTLTFRKLISASSSKILSRSTCTVGSKLKKTLPLMPNEPPPEFIESPHFFAHPPPRIWAYSRRRGPVQEGVQPAYASSKVRGISSAAFLLLSNLPVSDFLGSAPLLKEKGNSAIAALLADCDYPFSFHRSGTRAAFTADNDPMYPS